MTMLYIIWAATLIGVNTLCIFNIVRQLRRRAFVLEAFVWVFVSNSVMFNISIFPQKIVAHVRKYWVVNLENSDPVRLGRMYMITTILALMAPMGLSLIVYGLLTRGIIRLRHRDRQRDPFLRVAVGLFMVGLIFILLGFILMEIST